MAEAKMRDGVAGDGVAAGAENAGRGDGLMEGRR